MSDGFKRTYKQGLEEAQAEAAVMREALEEEKKEFRHHQCHARGESETYAQCKCCAARRACKALSNDAGCAFLKGKRKAEDRAEFAEAAVKRAVEATEQTQTPLAEEEELHDWIVRNEEAFRRVRDRVKELNVLAGSLTDQCVYYRNLAVAHGAKEGFVDGYDRELAERDEARERRIKELEAEVARLKHAPSAEKLLPEAPMCTGCGDRTVWVLAMRAFYCIGCDKTVEPPDYATKAEVRELARACKLWLANDHPWGTPKFACMRETFDILSKLIGETEDDMTPRDNVPPMEGEEASDEAE